MIWTIFDLTDSSGRLLYTKLHISPKQSGFAYEGSIITSDTIHVLENKAPTAAIPLVPNTYTVQGFGRNSQTSFCISLPLGLDNSTQSAADFITMTPCNYNISSSWAATAGFAESASNVQTSSFALTAITASYALNGGGGGGYAYVTASNLQGGQPPWTPPGPQFAVDTSDGSTWFYYNNQWN